MRSEYIWGIDLGGTKIEGIISLADDLTKPIIRERILTESGKGYDHIISRISELVGLMKQKSGLNPERIGFGTPGILDPQMLTMKNCNTTCLNGRALHNDLQSKLNVKVTLANDANCFALSESLFGAGEGVDSVFGIILGTGVGGGLVINGKLHTGLHGIAGEWGHNILIEGGEPCYCGKSGCVETVISGPSLEKYYHCLSGNKLGLAEIIKSKGDKFSEDTILRLVQYFSKAVSVVINIFDPEVIVIGGGLSNLDILYSKSQSEISKYIFNNKLATKIVKNELGDSAGVFGAALLCKT